MLRSIAIGAVFVLALAHAALAEDATPVPAAAPATATPTAIATAPASAETAAATTAAATTTAAVVVPQAVKDACEGDYQKLCSEHDPESDGVRECMARAFDKLSDGCVNAILDSPLADQPAGQVAAFEEPAQASAQAPATRTRPAQSARASRNANAVRAHNGARIKRAAGTPRKVVRARKYATRVAQTGRSGRPKPHVRAARHAAKAVKAYRAPVRYASNRDRGSKRSVAGYVRRGTGIAGYYIRRYVRFASW